MKIEIYKPNPETGTYFPAEDYTSQIQLGSSVIKRLDRELDTGQFVIPFSYEEKPLPVFSIVDFIVEEQIVDSYIIADDHVQLISKSPNVYKHIITLIEHTKILEKFYIGGKTFTQPTESAKLSAGFYSCEDFCGESPENLIDADSRFYTLDGSWNIDTTVFDTSIDPREEETYYNFFVDADWFVYTCFENDGTYVSQNVGENFLLLVFPAGQQVPLENYFALVKKEENGVIKYIAKKNFIGRAQLVIRGENYLFGNEVEEIEIYNSSLPQDPDKLYLPYTLYDVVKTLRETVPFDTVENINNDNFRVFDIPQETQDELDAIIAPEFVFKDVTLRQALDEVASVLDGIVRLERNPENENKRLLYVDKFNELQDKLDEIDRRKIEYNHDIEYYSTNMITDAINPVDSLEGRTVETYPAENRFTTLRSDDFIYNPETSYIPTPRRIYRLDRVLLKYNMSLQFNNDDFSPTVLMDNETVTIDITDRIVESEKRRTLTTETTTPTPFVSLFDRNNYFKNNTFEYTYGSKNIKTGDTFGIFNVSTAFNYVVQNALMKDIYEGNIPKVIEAVNQFNAQSSEDDIPHLTGQENTGATVRFPDVNNTVYSVNIVDPLEGNNYGVISFEKGQVLASVSYTPIPKSVRFETQRDNIDDVNYRSYNTANQKLRIVDLSGFTNNLKSRINRMGTVDYEFSARHKNWGDIYNVGDYTKDGFVITIKEIIIQKDHFVVIYKLNKDFNKISEFIGLDQQIRQWEIGERDRTVERDEFYSEVCELELTNEDENGNHSQNSLFNEEFVKLTLETFSNTQSRNIVGSFGINTNTVWESPDEEKLPFRSFVSAAKQAGGNTLSMNFELEDNVSVGNRLVEKGWLGIESNEMQPTRYTNQFGKIENLNLKLGYLETPNDYSLLEIANSMPASYTLLDDSYFNGNFKLHKDNREIIKFNLMLHFLPKKNNDIIVGNKFTEKNSAFIYNYFDNDGQDLSKQLYLIRFPDGRKFSKRSVGKIDISGGVFNFLIATADIDIDNYRIRITDNTYKTAIEEGSTWAIIDGEQNLLIGVNEPKTTILFNFKPKREGIIY